ncbi:MAG: adenine phosphoribosyltransferase, partial [Pseudomonadota bacterium]
LFGDARAFEQSVRQLCERVAGARFDKIAGIEARGFILGGAMAHRLEVGFVPIRKKGKLPWKSISQDYSLEYGVDQMEMHVDAVEDGERVLLVDDLIATGGTAEAGAALVERCGGAVADCAFIIDLPDLGGAAKLRAAGRVVHALIDFEGD